MSPHGSLHSEGEDELADEAFDRRPDQAGPSTRTQREEALATATASTSSSTPASNEQRIPLDGKAAYPWADVRFFLPEWLPDAIYDHVAVRLKVSQPVAADDCPKQLTWGFFILFRNAMRNVPAATGTPT
jgi:hypothetical protein